MSSREFYLEKLKSHQYLINAYMEELKTSPDKKILINHFIYDEIIEKQNTIQRLKDLQEEDE